MNESPSGTPIWQLTGFRAQLQFRCWSASVDLAKPYAGISVWNSAQHASDAASILGIAKPTTTEWHGQPVDAYTRDGDLVAVYPACADRPFRVEIYWSATDRVWDDVTVLQFDLVVSVQTEQLGIVAQLDTLSRISATSVWISGDPGWRHAREVGNEIRHTGVQLQQGKDVPCVHVEFGAASAGEVSDGRMNFTYVEAVAPSDFLGSELGWSLSQVGLRHHLLDEVMEKGVIRRLRVRGWLLTGKQSFSLSAAAYREFLADPLPLTT